jgi:hypothetical protein
MANEKFSIFQCKTGQRVPAFGPIGGSCSIPEIDQRNRWNELQQLTDHGKTANSGIENAYFHGLNGFSFQAVINFAEQVVFMELIFLL